MTSKSKTKKVFIEINTETKPQENNTINHLLRRFKSHDVYPSSKVPKQKLSNPILKNSNDNSTITINLNTPNAFSINAINSSIKNSNPKRIFTGQKNKSLKPKSSKIDWMKQGENKINSYINSGRKRNKSDTTKILNEESIQELETEENCKIIIFNYL